MAEGAGNTDVQAVGVIELDKNGDTLWTWVYPAFPVELRTIINRKVNLKDAATSTETKTVFGHVKNSWYYVSTFSNAAFPESKLTEVTAFATVILAKEFNPEKYTDLATIFAEKYTSSGNATTLLGIYLSVFVKGSFGKRFTAKEYDIRQAYIKTPITDLVRRFQVETILIYVAVLIKKRVLVYTADPALLLNVVRTIPQLVWYRKDWNILRPWIHLEGDELSELEGSTHYVAGTCDSDAENREDLYDIFVNVDGGTVTVASHSTDDFALGKIHKEIAMYLVSALENEEETEGSIVKQLDTKTKDVLKGLMKLSSDSERDPSKKIVTEDNVRAQKIGPSMQTFLINLAKAESLLEA